MAREFRLPDIGEGLTEADIVRWLVAEGETVEADQPIVEVETDKAVVEIPSPYAGTVLQHGGAEGDTIPVGAILVVIGDATGETPEPAPPAEPEPESARAVGHAPGLGRNPLAEAPPMVGTLSEEAEVLESTPEPIVSESAAVKALPIVRKMAREHGIDLQTVTGTGPDGRITREDLQAHLSSFGSEATVSPPATVSSPSSEASLGEVARRAGGGEVEDRPGEAPHRAGGGEDRRVPMTRLRRTIAANMSRSWAEVPHVTTFDDIDATRLLEVREALGERHGVKIPIEALVVRAVLPALEAFPEFNATVDGDDLVIHGSHDIGVAVDTPQGLIVAVIADADAMSVLDLATEVRRLGEGGRSRTLTPEELSGQTFTVSNIGAVGGGHGTPIVPPGTTAILSVGRAQQKPIVFQDELVIAPVMPLSLSYDHRVIDGAVGRRFMTLLMENLEEPALFLAG